MKSNKYDDLQFVLACLSTHSKWVKEIGNDYSKLSAYFHLAATDNLLFQNFMIEHYQKVWTASILSEEKRWREMLLTIPYTAKLFDIIALKNYWEDYLNLSSPLDNIPSSPIYESIAFLHYLQTLTFDRIHNQIIVYEYLRNKTLTFEFDCDQFNNGNYNFLKEREEKFLQMCALKINPSFILKSFGISLISAINHMQNESLSENINDSNHSYIGFYKNRYKGIVKTLELSEILYVVLLTASTTTNALALINQFSYSTNIHFTTAFDYLKKLQQEDILFISILN